MNSRGIIHTRHAHNAPPATSIQPVTAPGLDAAFARPKELCTLASETLGVAERVHADSVPRQMRAETELDA